ncbi:MAG: GyrI-like domain-containing protein [Actinobacteria bacterium]|nr:GyrI-like domain-containing protein [Actinomycetota bacterium]MCG2807744.1 GyrI-like domain-containing protein [Coriobacteriia bacterium]
MTPRDDRAAAALYKQGLNTPVLIDVPPMRFLQLDGAGDIGGETFQEAVGALFGLAYPIKFAAKKQLGLVYKVAPLEGLYWQTDPEREFAPVDRATLAWRLMIMLPDEVDGELVEAMREKVATKKNPPRLAEIRLQTFSEGPSVELLHIGPYSEEPATVKRLLDFAAERGYEVIGKHHEIYLGDPNRAAAEKLKTLLRYGVRKARG